MAVKVEPHPEFKGVYQVVLEDGTHKIASENLAPGRDVYGERLIKSGAIEYRVWDPYRSKLSAAIFRGLRFFPIKHGDRVLYLGAASGTTASHVSDIIGVTGHVFCVEFAQRSIRDLIDNVARFRMNMSPILADARFPEKYISLVEKVDCIYCDVAQPEQAQILANNAKVFLKKGRWALLAIKSRSIDVTKKPQEIYDQEIQTLEKKGFKIFEVIYLQPYDQDHVMILAHY